MKKVFYIIIPIVILAVGFNIFKSDEKGKTSDSCVLTAKEYVSADKSDAVVIDVRTQREFDSGHLEGAKMIDINQRSFVSEIQKLDKNKKYFVYCKTGIRSRSAANYMRKEGFKNVCELEGGTNSLSRAGIKLVK